MGQFNFKEDLLNNGGRYVPPKAFGVYKAIPTGRFIEGDFQYVEMKVLGMTLPIRPCFSDMWVPSKEWLDKYGDKMFALVSFENGDLRSGFWFGMCFKDGKQNDVDNFPHSRVRRMISLIEEINDTDETITVTHRESGDFMQFGVDGWKAQLQSWLADIVGEYRVNSNSTIINSEQIAIGSENASEALVLGTTMNNTWTEELTELTSLLSQLNAGLSSMATAAAGNPNTAGLAPGFSQLASVVSASGSKLQSISSKLAQHLSPKTKVE
jgi:hypothetical protein